MNLQERLNQQRVKYIISSYQLAGDEGTAVETCVEALLQAYPPPLVELALVECLVRGWLSVPMVKGMAFFRQVHKTLRTWETQPIITSITPGQFKQITNLDPTPVFGTAESPPSYSIVRPS